MGRALGRAPGRALGRAGVIAAAALGRLCGPTGTCQSWGGGPVLIELGGLARG